MLDLDPLIQQVRFRVRNDLYKNYYTVTVQKYQDPQTLSLRCQCPYNLSEICRHEVAALFQLQEIIQSGYFENLDIVYDQQHTVVRMRQVSVQMLQVFSSPEIMERAERWVAASRVELESSRNNQIQARIKDQGKEYTVRIKQNEDRYFDTSCPCGEKAFPLCVHKATVFLHLLKRHGWEYFQSMRDWDEQKNKLLSQYGFSLQDDLRGKFSFSYENGKPFLRVLDPSLKRIKTPEPKKEKAVAEKPGPGDRPSPAAVPELRRLGLVVDPRTSRFPYVQILLVSGPTDEENRKFTGPITVIPQNQYINPSPFLPQDRDLLAVVRKFHPAELWKHIRRHLPFVDFYDDYDQVFDQDPDPEAEEAAWDYLLPRYQRLLQRFSFHSLCFLVPPQGKIQSRDLIPIGFSDKKAVPRIQVRREGRDYVARLLWSCGESLWAFDQVRMLNPALVLHDYHLFAVDQASSLRLASCFPPEGQRRIPLEEWPDFLEQQLLPWSRSIKVDFDEDLMIREQPIPPRLHLRLEERAGHLLLHPQFLYGQTMVPWRQGGEVVEQMGDKLRIWPRDREKEESEVAFLASMHSDMKRSGDQAFISLPAASVIQDHWLFFFLERLEEKQISISGLEELKELRMNRHKPKTRVDISSGMDWFDARIDLVFGDQAVSIQDVKRAMAERKNYVRLPDGSMGMLPRDWMDKYALLVKMGEGRGDRLRIRKIHFNLLDELVSEIDEDQVQIELFEKKKRLREIIEAERHPVSAPPQLRTELRNYQLSGVQWIEFLQEAGWGGILADDMGLGKTVQTLAYFQIYKNRYPESRFLVVCPTTLMYNWEKEIQKFTPELRHFIHHGPRRKQSWAQGKKADILITTYGTMRSDIRLLREEVFDYVVLDESQSIKNPQSQVAKAALLLQAKHRLALSGTPVQNNTFDLYAQMNFLNPGMLGSREFFMSEFANPIDKLQDEEIKGQLKKLTYPFILRRTKEQVAADLPAKTETVLYCRMGKEQRRIYDAYRNLYRDQIMGLIDEKGIDRVQFHILQGLTKLRQICDSPAILNEEESYPNHSVKIEEMMREIRENAGRHKALIFSQFLGMLALIRRELDKAGIPYAYFDGSTRTAEREKAIKQFQEEEECRVFLISLKAGGIGLNLTAADYVYIVDPWWNPAVEQQAIDRTHRIGQTKSIFAYRLICQDTIEEKMLQLQERKRSLAAELVSDDLQMMKRLTREDLAFLLDTEG